MKKWSIKKRLFVCIAVLLTAFALSATVNVLSFNSVERDADQTLVRDAIPGINYIADITTQTLRAHIRTLMAGISNSAELKAKFEAQVAENAKKADEAIAHYRAAVTKAEDQANLEKLIVLQKKYRQARGHYLELADKGNGQEAEQYLLDHLDEDYRILREHLLVMLEWNKNVANQAAQNIVATADKAKLQTIYIALGSILAACALAFYLIKIINQSLTHIANTLQDAAGQVTAAAGQVSSSSQSLAQGASEQAASLEETSASLEEVSSMSRRNSESAASARDLAKDANNSTESGKVRMKEMVDAMDAIRSSSNNIAAIIKTIDEIAFQTNILALNAAVEAARAGEAGAGFAVVADEVRNLAQRAAAAAKETSDKIEDSIQKSNHGQTVSHQVAKDFDEISSKASQVNVLVSEIATASNEQLQGLSQINTAVGQLDQVTQKNAANAEETAGAAEELNAQSLSMRESVDELMVLVTGGKRVEA